MSSVSLEASSAAAIVFTLLALGVPSLLWLLYPITSNKACDVRIDSNIVEVSLVRNKSVETVCKECGEGVEDGVDVSIIVPAYNEEERLPVMLEAALAYLEPWSNGSKTGGGKSKKVYEIVVVDDGSSDDTIGVALEVGNRFLKQKRSRNVIRVLKLPTNCGKGGAVKRGFLRARGKYILMADADGATEISEIANLYRKIKEIEKGGSGLAIGSRAHLEEQAKASRAWYRTLLMRGLHLCVVLLCTRRVRDTQCGFKLFTRSSGRLLFGLLHLQRWAFDIEIIYLAEHHGVPLVESSVQWREVDGSKLIQTKLDVIKTSVTMLRDMICVNIAYSLGIWSKNII